MDHDFQQLERSPKIEARAVSHNVLAAGRQVFMNHAVCTLALTSL